MRAEGAGGTAGLGHTSQHIKVRGEGWQRQHIKDCAVDLEMLRLDLLSWGAPAGNLGSCASMWNVPG